MKFLLIFLLAISPELYAQNYSVKLYGSNPSGIPENWPERVQPIGGGTNVTAPYVLMSASVLDNCIATNKAAYTAWESNQTYSAKAKLDADLADFLTKMDKIETWIDKTSGTNSLSNNQRDNAINDICQTFKKIRPILKNLYQQSQ